MGYLTFFILNAIGQFLILLIFLTFFIKRRKGFLLPTIVHISSAFICYEFNLQPWTIIFFVIIWLISGFLIFKLRWNKELKKGLKIALVSIAVLHSATWSDAFYAKLIQSGLYGHYVKHVVINEDYNIRSRRSGNRRYWFVDIVNKKHPLIQKITPLGDDYYGDSPVKDSDWSQLEGDSISIKLFLDTSYNIYLPDY